MATIRDARQKASVDTIDAIEEFLRKEPCILFGFATYDEEDGLWVRCIPKDLPCGRVLVNRIENGVRSFVRGDEFSHCKITWHTLEAFIDTSKRVRTDLRDALKKLDAAKRRNHRMSKTLKIYESLAPELKTAATTVEGVEEDL